MWLYTNKYANLDLASNYGVMDPDPGSCQDLDQDPNQIAVSWQIFMSDYFKC